MVRPKANTIDLLVRQAVFAFAEHGYVGSSLREIAMAAGVPHSMIGHYFGSKHDLFLAAGRWAWEDFDTERVTLLNDALERYPDAVPLPELMRCIAYPTVRRAMSEDLLERSVLTLLTSHFSETHRSNRLLDRVDRSITRWISALSQTCPTLSHDDVIWAFSFCIGAIYSWQLTSHRYDNLLDDADGRTVDSVTADLVAFATAGIESIVVLRSSRPSPERI